VGATPEEDARNAVNGIIETEYGFHTECDDNPWWAVDLGNISSIHQIRIFNRDTDLDGLRRASPLVAEVSNDKITWKLVFQTAAGQVFGGYRGSPLLWRCTEPVEGRFVRLSIPRQEYLHLAEVEIYGVADSIGPRELPADSECLEERLAPPNQGSNKSLANRRSIMTSHETVLFFDPESGEVRHGDQTSSPHNLTLDQNGKVAHLLAVSDKARHVISIPTHFDGPIGTLTWTGAEFGNQGSEFEIVPVDESLFGLRCQGLFLCAEPNGLITLSRHHLSQWETFRLADRVVSPEAT
jgi:hypothetical protein